MSNAILSKTDIADEGKTKKKSSMGAQLAKSQANKPDGKDVKSSEKKGSKPSSVGDGNVLDLNDLRHMRFENVRESEFPGLYKVHMFLKTGGYHEMYIHSRHAIDKRSTKLHTVMDQAIKEVLTKTNLVPNGLFTIKRVPAKQAEAKLSELIAQEDIHIARQLYMSLTNSEIRDAGLTKESIERAKEVDQCCDALDILEGAMEDAKGEYLLALRFTRDQIMRYQNRKVDLFLEKANGEKSKTSPDGFLLDSNQLAHTIKSLLQNDRSQKVLGPAQLESLASFSRLVLVQAELATNPAVRHYVEKHLGKCSTLPFVKEMVDAFIGINVLKKNSSVKLPLSDARLGALTVPDELYKVLGFDFAKNEVVKATDAMTALLNGIRPKLGTGCTFKLTYGKDTGPPLEVGTTISNLDGTVNKVLGATALDTNTIPPKMDVTPVIKSSKALKETKVSNRKIDLNSGPDEGIEEGNYPILDQFRKAPKQEIALGPADINRIREELLIYKSRGAPAGNVRMALDEIIQLLNRVPEYFREAAVAAALQRLTLSQPFE